MIKINLLPGKRRKKAFKLDNRFVPGIAFGVLAVIVMVILFFHLNNQIDSIKADKVIKESRLAELKVKLKEVEDYEKDNELYRLKNKVIEQLKANQGLPLRLLDEVSELLPKGVWITSLADKGGMVSLQGFAFTNPNLVNYVQNLKGSKYLADVSLIESKQTKVGDAMIYGFKLSFRMKI
jgi:type IV pilus assembly protein PilN